MMLDHYQQTKDHLVSYSAQKLDFFWAGQIPGRSSPDRTQARLYLGRGAARQPTQGPGGGDCLGGRRPGLLLCGIPVRPRGESLPTDVEQRALGQPVTG